MARRSRWHLVHRPDADAPVRAWHLPPRLDAVTLAPPSQAPFDGDEEFGDRFLTFEKGMRLHELKHAEADENLAFGVLAVETVPGWFPSNYLARDVVAHDSAESLPPRLDAVTLAPPSQALPARRLASGITKAPFRGDDFGDEFLSFERGLRLHELEHVDADENWAFGVLDEEQGGGGGSNAGTAATAPGWFPSNYLARDAVASILQSPAAT
eukprot:NODE_11315_length_1295_cov_2.459760.p1 GENE.NODE_11315_length_1295_cov_2.459760~~NODE_11315_length_1295_cov_2.459760.p1  ORF type:complete len:212 (-),score=40.87 NODE_11315_length_1295_cov_2.459760:559-1194(-)